jgi:AraC-like DNA-binding protein
MATRTCSARRGRRAQRSTSGSRSLRLPELARRAGDVGGAGSTVVADRLAEHVGYESEAAFSRAFKRAYGRAPGAWRRLSR